eukprot:1812482-Rhodomonas_salina.1
MQGGGHAYPSIVGTRWATPCKTRRSTSAFLEISPPMSYERRPSLSYATHISSVNHPLRST